MSLITLAGIGFSLLALVLFRNEKVMLVQESAFTLLLGIGCFASLLAWRRPLMFYFARYFECGNDPKKMAEFEDDYVKYELARHVHKLLTIVWGVAFISQFLAKAIMVYTLSTEQVLGLGPIVTNGIQFATIAWTLTYVKVVRSRARAAQVQADSPGEP